MRLDVIFYPKKCIAKNQEFQGKVLQGHFVADGVIDKCVEVLVSLAA
jgi:threonine synthase